jgi:hypothetical protein
VSDTGTVRGTSVPDTSFAFEYDPAGGQNGRSVTVRHDDGDGVQADRLMLRSSAGHDALWSELGSTDVAASERVTAGDTDAFETSQDRGGGGELAHRAGRTAPAVNSGMTVAGK